MTEAEIIDGILKAEGGYVNHPDDRGGPTNFGITLGTLAEWRGSPVDATDVMNLTEAEARDIYRQRYIREPCLDWIADDKLRTHLVDCAVNHGPRQAVLFLQRSIGADALAEEGSGVDGILGPGTLRALSKFNALSIRVKVCAARARFYGRLITQDHSQAVFALGWANRVASFIEDVA